MSHYQVILRAMAITVVLSLLSGCGRASPTAIVIEPTSASAPIRPAISPAVRVTPDTAASEPAATEASAADGTLAVQPSPTLAGPKERPFLMRIDRISLIVGRGTLLEGRVANGTLQANGNVEILGPQTAAISTTVLRLFIGNVAREQITVGDQAGILVGGVEPTQLSPGMLLAEAGAFESYEAALQQLQ